MGLLNFFLLRPDGRAGTITPMPLAGRPVAPLTGKQKGGLILTAAAAFGLIMADVYVDEGGYVNDKTDRGGETNHGVTIAVARQSGYLGAMRDYPRHCADAETHCADQVYRKRYIAGPGFEPMLAIEPAVAQKLINTGINMGPSWPTMFFQQSIKAAGVPVVVDRRMGAGTVAAYRSMQAKYGKVRACNIVLDGMIAGQLNRYNGIMARSPSQAKYRNGWTKRAKSVRRDWCGRGEVA